MSEKLDALVDQLSKLTVTQAVDLAKQLEEKWGIDTSALAVAPAADGGAVEEKATATVHLTGYAEGKKILVIKTIRGILGLGLMEAKEFVEGLPKDVEVDIEKEKAEEIKKQLEEIGGTVELK
jgi:large subunit ribosomal protein L7/L12|tara:strand:- start:593 stop:961 length:369 start_codon:yes stop_codon:yes gene_type:complete